MLKKKIGGTKQNGIHNPTKHTRTNNPNPQNSNNTKKRHDKLPQQNRHHLKSHNQQHYLQPTKPNLHNRHRYLHKSFDTTKHHQNSYY